MISAISNTQQNVYSAATVAGVASVAAKEKAISPQRAEESKRPRTDSVEISASGREAVQMAKMAAAESNATSGTSDVKAASLMDEDKVSSQAAAKSGEAILNSAPPTDSTQSSAASTDTGSSTASSTPVLSTLSEQDMDKLVAKGTITNAQKQTEIAKRNKAAEQQNQEPVKQTKENMAADEKQTIKSATLAENNRYDSAVAAYSQYNGTKQQTFLPDLVA